jgi:hypothetical protein
MLKERPTRRSMLCRCASQDFASSELYVLGPAFSLLGTRGKADERALPHVEQSRPRGRLTGWMLIKWSG